MDTKSVLFGFGIAGAVWYFLIRRPCGCADAAPGAGAGTPAADLLQGGAMTHSAQADTVYGAPMTAGFSSAGPGPGPTSLTRGGSLVTALQAAAEGVHAVAVNNQIRPISPAPIGFLDSPQQVGAFAPFPHVSAAPLP